MGLLPEVVHCLDLGTTKRGLRKQIQVRVGVLGPSYEDNYLQIKGRPLSMKNPCSFQAKEEAQSSIKSDINSCSRGI